MKAAHMLAIGAGIIGILAGIVVIGVGFMVGVFESVSESNSGQDYFLYGGGLAAIFISVVGMAASFIKKKYVAGGVVIVCGVAGLIAISLGYIISFPLFLISGILLIKEGYEKDHKEVERQKEKSAHIYCSKCGRRISTDYKHCPHCGAAQKEEQIYRTEEG